MRLYTSIFLALCLTSAYFSCIPPESGLQGNQNTIQLNMADKEVQKLYDLRDHRQVDSLLVYLKSEDASSRYLAALAFASMQDTNHLAQIAALLNDPIEDVRIAAAFALGQTHAAGAETYLIEAFDGGDSLSRHQRFNAIILEAVGKCGSAESLQHIANITTYNPTDTLLLEGKNRAVYQFALRKMYNPDANAAMLKSVTNDRLPESARLMAAHALSRNESFIPDSLQATRLAAAYVRSKNPHIRMALATALGKSNVKPAFSILTKVIENERDWRVSCNIIKALGKFESDTIRKLLIPYLENKNPHISRTVAEFFIENGTLQDADVYWRLSRERPKLKWPTRVALYHASHKWLNRIYKPESRDFVIYRLREQYLAAESPYERAACLRALAESGWQFRWIYKKGMQDSHPAVKSAAAEALKTIANRTDFYRHMGEGAGAARREIYRNIREMIATSDPGLIASGAGALRSNTLNYKTLRDTSRLKDLRTTLRKLKLPRDLEAYMELSKTIAYFENKPEPAPFVPAFQNPIDWGLLNTLESGQRVRMITNKGTVELELYPQWAPGSVVNFLKLINDGFYSDNSIHRVVPNFVVQGGCPRGDGFGALDYSIRSEIGISWYDDAGYLGMASAGPDTEGTQWFITHKPTPHLDGRYTIFGKVYSGMEVVEKLVVGDKIEKMELTSPGS